MKQGVTSQATKYECIIIGREEIMTSSNGVQNLSGVMIFGKANQQLSEHHKALRMYTKNDAKFAKIDKCSL